jgi:predicted O-linked N-acetylglucosamine transferase (SPINDLY family)
MDSELPPVPVLLQQAMALHRMGDRANAQILYEEVALLEPSNFEALQMLGVLAYQENDFVAAAEWMAKSIAANPRDASGHCNLGLALHRLGKRAESIASYERAVALKPDFAEAHFNCGNVLAELERLDAALDCYRRAIQYRPAFAEAHAHCAAVLLKLQQPEAALSFLDRAIAMAPQDFQSYSNRAAALGKLRRYGEALECCDRAISLRPDHSQTNIHRGNILTELGRVDEALSSYERAIASGPQMAEGHAALASLLDRLNRKAEALQSYERALQVNHDLDFFAGVRLHLKMQLCDWRNLESELAGIVERIAQGKKAIAPFALLALCDSPSVHLQAARIWMNANAPAAYDLGPFPVAVEKQRIRLGYYSADFHDHATAYLAAELFELHDRSRFEVIAFSYGPDRKDAMRTRLSAAFDQFIDVAGKSDREVAEISRKMGIDVAIDLKGYTTNHRGRIFSFRPAPVQVSYLGYPGTLAAPYIDYLIADPTLIPEHLRLHYVEKIAYLPDSYQANDTRREIAVQEPSRRDAGLPETGFVFCCFNNNFKITPVVFDSWMRILRQVDGSVLWLLRDSHDAASNLMREATSRGIHPQRLVFAERIPLDAHLARHRLADLFLDTLPYNAHTTTSDALWSGLPVITCLGEGFAGRVAASLLRAVDLPELVTCTASEYESLAVSLAKEPSRLALIKERLKHNRATAALFDSRRFTGYIEALYTQMYQRYRAGLAPEDMVVPAMR